jgi:hypothetical protein
MYLRFSQVPQKKKKNPINQNQKGSSSIKSTRQMRTQVDTTPKANTKANNQQKQNQAKIICKEDSWVQNDNQ